MNLNKLLCAGVAGALLAGALAGCSAPAPQPTPDPDDIAYQAAGITRDTVMYTVDGTDVTADEYLFWLLTSINQAKGGGYLADDAAWEEELDGQPTAEFLKNDALETSKLYTVVANKAAEAGVALTEEEQADAQEQMDALAEQVETYYGIPLQDWLDGQCITQEGFVRLNNVSYLAQGLQKQMEENGELESTEAELDDMIEELGYYKAKHILLSTVDEEGAGVGEEEKAGIKEEADALLAQIRAAGDPLAEFDAVMNERSDDDRGEDGALAMPDGYLAYSGQMDAEFEQGAKALDVGEISEPIETQFGYHIILRLDFSDEERQQLRDSMQAYYPNYAMSNLNQQWVEGAQVELSQAFTELDPKAFYDKVVELNAAREAARAAAETPTPAESGEPAPSGSGSPDPEASPAAAPEESPAAGE